jgi:DNA-binding transcriptional MerR regulator
MTVGELARRAGVGVETIRYYERRGLLDEPTRAANGYRTYGPAELDRLALIARAKGLGFTLAEIAELTGASDPDAILDRAQSKLAHIDVQVAELEQMRDRLVSLLEVCGADDEACISLEV